MKSLILLFLLLNILFSKESNEDALEYTIGISVQNNDFRMIKDIRLGFSKIFTDSLIVDNTKINLKFFDNTKDLVEDFSKKKTIDILTIQGFNYLKHKDKIKKSSNMFFAVKDSENKHKQYYLIANKSSNVNSLKDIQNKKLTFHFENRIIGLWFDKLSLEVNKKPYKTLIKEEIKKKSESLAILDVYFKKSDIAIVSKLAWDIMIEFNPNLMKKVKIIKKSKKIFFFSVAFLNKEKEKDLARIFLKITREKVYKDKIEELLSLAKAKHMNFETKEYLAGIEEFYKEYLKLKKRYNK